MSREMLLVLAVVFSLAIPGEALASSTGLRQIVNIGCHVKDNTCWVDISGSAAGPASCRSTSLRWSQTEPNGKNILSLLTAAFLAGKSVNFELIDNACYAAQPSYPTINWINFI